MYYTDETRYSIRLLNLFRGIYALRSKPTAVNTSLKLATQAKKQDE